MDQARKLLPLNEADPKALRTPLTGFWVACGPLGARDPLVWAAAVRFYHSRSIQDRALQGGSAFLLLLFAAGASAPQCFECSFDEPAPGKAPGLAPTTARFRFAGTLRPGCSGDVAGSFELVLSGPLAGGGGDAGRAGGAGEGFGSPGAALRTPAAAAGTSALAASAGASPASAPARAAVAAGPARPPSEELPLRTGAPELPPALTDDAPLGEFFWRPDPSGPGEAPGASAGTAKVLVMQQQQITTLQQQVRVLQQQLEKVQTEGSGGGGGLPAAGPGLLGGATVASPSPSRLTARRYPEETDDAARSTEDMRTSLGGGGSSVTSSQDKVNLSSASSASGLDTVRSSLSASVDPEAVASLKEALANAVTRAANAASVAIHGSKGSSAAASMEVSLADSRDSGASSEAVARALLDLPSTSSSGDSLMLEDEDDFGAGARPPKGLMPSDALDDLGVPRMKYQDLSDNSDDEETERLITKYLGRDTVAAFMGAEA